MSMPCHEIEGRGRLDERGAAAARLCATTAGAAGLAPAAAALYDCSSPRPCAYVHRCRFGHFPARKKLHIFVLKSPEVGLDAFATASSFCSHQPTNTNVTLHDKSKKNLKKNNQFFP